MENSCQLAVDAHNAHGYNGLRGDNDPKQETRLMTKQFTTTQKLKRMRKAWNVVGRNLKDLEDLESIGQSLRPREEYCADLCRHLADMLAQAQLWHEPPAVGAHPPGQEG
jgi:hypothetical protein